MTHSRRSILRKASALSALAIGASATASAADCSGAPAWDATTLYSSGDQVEHPDGDGVDALWEAALDSRNAEPSRSSAYWDHVGDCDGGGGNEAPTASFTTDVSTPEPGQDVTFDASGSSDPDGSISSYGWDFGDGSTGSGQSVSHSYGSSGDYTVTLTVTDDAGATDTDQTTVSVSSGTSNEAPDASFTVSPSAPDPGESATFDAADSSDPDGSISSYDWDFGDGSSASGQTASHSYSSEGDYTVTLTVTDDDGATDSNATTVTVQSSGGGGGEDCSGVPEWDPDVAYGGGDQVTYEDDLFTAEWWTRGSEPDDSKSVWTLEGSCGGGGNGAPDASFTSSPAAPDPGETVTFDASGSSDPDGDSLTYDWAFGDGSTGSGQTTSHSYGSEGSYTVTLTVSDGNGNGDSDSSTLSVSTGGGGGTGDQAFAPYATTWGDGIVTQTQEAGLNHVSIAFVTDGGNGDYSLNVSPSEVQELQDMGVEVTLSVGGWDTATPSSSAPDAETLKDTYVDLVDTYGVTHVDIDDEAFGTNWQMRNTALSMLQDERPEVLVSYTLMMQGTQMSTSSRAPAKDILQDAVDKGVNISYANPMTMDIEPTNADTIAEAATNVHSFLGELYPNRSASERWGMVGITPMIGVQNSCCNHLELTPSEAQNLVDWADQQGVGMLTFWSIERDRGGADGVTSGSHCGIPDVDRYEYTNIFKGFE